MKATTQRDNKLRMTQRLSWASLAAREGGGRGVWGSELEYEYKSECVCEYMERVCGCLHLSLSLWPCLSLAHIYLSTWPHPPSSSSSRDGGTGRIINYSRDQIICVSRCRGNSGSFPLPPAPCPFPVGCIFFRKYRNPLSLSRCSPPALAMPAI